MERRADRIAQALALPELFPGRNEFGNYSFEQSKNLPPHLTLVPTNGVIRTANRLGVPSCKVVNVECAYGNHYFPVVYGYVIPTASLPLLNRPAKKIAPHPDLLLCIREASRAAHRERDKAQQAYQAGRHVLAGNSKKRKERWYALKDRGIVAAHTAGLLRYIGHSPQGMAVYEYGEGGMACFHSTLHPSGVESPAIENHPETLEVPAKDKVKGVSLARVKATLQALPEDVGSYVRSKAPRRKSAPLICWRCGEEGHLARECWQDEGPDDIEYAAGTWA
jgi:hypothetical protein